MERITSSLPIRLSSFLNDGNCYSVVPFHVFELGYQSAQTWRDITQTLIADVEQSEYIFRVDYHGYIFVVDILYLVNSQIISVYDYTGDTCIVAFHSQKSVIEKSDVEQLEQYLVDFINGYVHCWECDYRMHKDDIGIITNAAIFCDDCAHLVC